MCRSLAAVFVVAFAAAAAIADSPDATTTDRVLRASCRIFAGNARGSGVIFDAATDKNGAGIYRVLTNAHVVGRTGNRVRLEFEHSGYRSRPIAGRVVRSHIARNSSIDLAIVELPRAAFPGPMPVVPLAEVSTQSKGLLDGETVLTCGAQGGAAVSLQRGHVVRQTSGLIYYKPEALPGRSGSLLFNEAGTKVVGLVAWRTGDGHGLAMNAARVRAFVRGEVAEAESELPNDAIPLWQSRVRLVLVTSHGCQPCELQKQSMPDDVRYETVDIKNVIAKGYDVRVTPTLMVFVDNQLKHTASGLLRGDRLQAFLARWGFSNRNEDDQPKDADLSDDLNPWSNPRRWERGPIRDRIDDAKTRFAWWILAKWLGFATGGVAFVIPWVVLLWKTWQSQPKKPSRKTGRRQPTRKSRVRKT